MGLSIALPVMRVTLSPAFYAVLLVQAVIRVRGHLVPLPAALSCLLAGLGAAVGLPFEPGIFLIPSLALPDYA